MSQKLVRSALESRLRAFATSKSLLLLGRISLVRLQRATLEQTDHGPIRNPSMGTQLDGRAHKRFSGIYRVQVLLTDLNKGPATIETLAEELINWFPRGLSLVSGGVTVNFDNTPSMSSIDNDANWVYVSVDIPYRMEVY